MNADLLLSCSQYSTQQKKGKDQRKTANFPLKSAVFEPYAIKKDKRFLGKRCQTGTRGSREADFVGRGARERADDVFCPAGIKRRRSKADFAPTWCERGDLNSHAIRHTPLKRACLPIPALSHIDFYLNSASGIINAVSRIVNKQIAFSPPGCWQRFAGRARYLRRAGPGSCAASVNNSQRIISSRAAAPQCIGSK